MRTLHTILIGSLSLALAASASAQSASFVNTVDGYLEAPYDATVVPSTGLTVEAWVTYDETTIGPSWRYPTIVRQNGTAGQESFFLRVESGDSQSTSIRFLVNTQGSGAISVNWNFGPGGLLNWTHLAGTYDGASMKLYADGILVASSFASGPLVDQGGYLRIGKGSDVASPIEVWNGSIDEVRLWPFARTAGEIMGTKDFEMTSFPGKVSTWNLNGSGVDSSGGNSMTAFGSVSFDPTGAALTLKPFPGAAFGTSTAGCLGPISATVGSPPVIGNPSFSMLAYPIPSSSPTFAYLGLASAATPLTLLGIDVYVDPFSAVGLFPATNSALGVSRFDFGIPGSYPPGLSATVQFVSLDPCGPQGFTASNALGFVTFN
ncbi:MAG: LamG domain-containing protein [Planctomycetota bacterium]|nr:LamG domain-containing protein [Planctomycetota bacterium]